MNLLAHLKTINLKNINFADENQTSFSLLSQIIPNITLKYKTKRFNDADDDYNSSNNVLELGMQKSNFLF